MNLGEKIIELRKKENLTQEKLAEKIGISRQTLFNWENNSTSPDINQAKKISEIFKISLDDLLDVKTEVQCSNNKSILSNLIGRECYLDADTDDYRLYYNTVCTIIDINISSVSNTIGEITGYDDQWFSFKYYDKSKKKTANQYIRIRDLVSIDEIK